MANYLRPRRGKRSTAESQNIILKKGEIFMEAPETGVGKGRGRIKIGDGVTAYTSLPYFYDYDNFITDLANSTISFTQTSETDNIVLLNRIATGAKVSIITAAEKNLLSNLVNSVSDISNSTISFTETSESDNDVLLSRIANNEKVGIITAAEKNLLSNLNSGLVNLKSKVDDIKDSKVSFTETSETNNTTLLNKIVSAAKISTITAAEKNLLSNLNTSVVSLQTAVADIKDSKVSFTETSETNNTTLLNRITSGAKISTITAAEKNLLNNLNSSITTINSNITSLQSAVADIKDSKVSFTETSESNNATLLSRIISGAKISVITAAEKNLLSNLNGSVSILNSTVNGHGTDIANLQSAVADIKDSKVSFSASSSGTIEQALAKIVSNAKVSTIVAEEKYALTALNSKSAEHTASILSLQDSVRNINNSISGLDGRVGLIETYITENYSGEVVIGPGYSDYNYFFITHNNIHADSMILVIGRSWYSDKDNPDNAEMLKITGMFYEEGKVTIYHEPLNYAMSVCVLIHNLPNHN